MTVVLPYTIDAPTVTTAEVQGNFEAVRDGINLVAGSWFGHTWTVGGTIAVPSGDTDFIPPIFVPVKSGVTTTLAKAKYIINSGTSATVKLQKAGVDITGFTAISVTTTAAETDPTNVAISDGDKIALVVTAVAGTPKNLSFTCVFETGV